MNTNIKTINKKIVCNSQFHKTECPFVGENFHYNYEVCSPTSIRKFSLSSSYSDDDYTNHHQVDSSNLFLGDNIDNMSFSYTS